MCGSHVCSLQGVLGTLQPHTGTTRADTQPRYLQDEAHQVNNSSVQVLRSKRRLFAVHPTRSPSAAGHRHLPARVSGDGGGVRRGACAIRDLLHLRAGRPVT